MKLQDASIKEIYEELQKRDIVTSTPLKEASLDEIAQELIGRSDGFLFILVTDRTKKEVEYFTSSYGPPHVQKGLYAEFYDRHWGINS